MRILVVCLLSAVFGSLIWHLTPFLTSHAEPWDASGGYYPFALFATGVVSALAAGREEVRCFWLWPIAVVVGQGIYIIFALPPSPLRNIGFGFLIGYGYLTLVGSGLAAWGLTRFCGESKPSEQDTPPNRA